MYHIDGRQSRGGESTVTGVVNTARLRPHLLTAPTSDRLVVAKFSEYRVRNKVPEESVIFGVTQMSL